MDEPMPHHPVHPHRPYHRLLLMVALSFVAMYVLMYVMVDELSNVLPNINQFYMAGLMTAPMVILELALMSTMYPNKGRNAALMVVSLVFGVVCTAGIRTQAGVDDEQFLQSMIPHHSGAILMCEKASLRDPEIRELCQVIIPSQQAEIDLMHAKLRQRGLD